MSVDSNRFNTSVYGELFASFLSSVKSYSASWVYWEEGRSLCVEKTEDMINIHFC